MTLIEAAREVTKHRQCHLVRERKGTPGQYDAKPYGEGGKRGWFYLDGVTASAIVNVYDALNETNKAKFSALPPAKMAHVAFKLCK